MQPLFPRQITLILHSATQLFNKYELPNIHEGKSPHYRDVETTPLPQDWPDNMKTTIFSFFVLIILLNCFSSFTLIF